MSRSWIVRPVGLDEFVPWSNLFRGYCDFYDVASSDEQLRQVWEWIHQDRCVDALVAVEVNEAGDEVGTLRGLAHVREFCRTLRGTKGGYLDDLFVDPDMRGTGVVDALFRGINDLAAERGWGVIRWITADDNYRARSFYDRVAQRTPWITYEMFPGSQS
jgi:GNAT superfamily N-acetyltransferase